MSIFESPGTRERARLKADLARDELEESSRRRAASKQLRQDEVGSSITLLALLL